MKNIFKLSVLATLCAGLLSCNNPVNNTDNTTSTTQNTSTTPAEKQTVPSFDENNAYTNIETQVSFGPRVPNTDAQLKCAAWLIERLQEACDTVYRQETTLLAGDKKTNLRCINIIGSINPTAKRRILLLAHWDTRPWADQDTKNKNEPILGADDGGSGVGILIEIARVLNANPLNNKDLGIDILFTDVEDYGKSEWGGASYALGTQFWAKNPHVIGYKAEAGILLDMVGAKNATFKMEGYSREYASRILRAVWQAANDAGFGSYFVHQNGSYIEDDHVPVNKITGIPTIDIINLPPNSNTGFVSHWHTHSDDMSNIDRATLKAVGQTLLQYLYTY